MIDAGWCLGRQKGVMLFLFLGWCLSCAMAIYTLVLCGWDDEATKAVGAHNPWAEASQ